MSTATAPQEVKRPNVKQRYRLAHLMTDLLGLDWPETSDQASEQIQRLEQLLAEQKGGNDDCPL